jgi:hypothetical protein
MLMRMTLVPNLLHYAKTLPTQNPKLADPGDFSGHALPLCASPSLSDFFIDIIIFVIRGRLGFAARDTISLLSPPSEINQLAAIRAERSIGIIFPLGFTATGWALDPKRHSLLLAV